MSFKDILICSAVNAVFLLIGITAGVAVGRMLH